MDHHCEVGGGENWEMCRRLDGPAANDAPKVALPPENVRVVWLEGLVAVKAEKIGGGACGWLERRESAAAGRILGEICVQWDLDWWRGCCEGAATSSSFC